MIEFDPRKYSYHKGEDRGHPGIIAEGKEKNKTRIKK